MATKQAVDQWGTNFTKVAHHDTYAAIDPTKFDHSGKIIFITGASKGLGREIAVSYAKAGAEGLILAARSDLSATEVDVQNAAKAAGKKVPKILKITLDVLDQKSAEEAARVVEKEFGRLDILINNAGYLSTFGPMAEVDADDWWMNWEVNIKGVYLVTRAFIPLMLKGGEKTIVNLSSVGALDISPSGSGYQSTKFALLRFTEFVDADYGNQGILAYAIHPGGVITELSKRLPESLHQVLVDTPQLAGDSLASLTSTKREWLAGRYLSVCWDLPEIYEREAEIVEEDKLKMRMRW